MNGLTSEASLGDLIYNEAREVCVGAQRISAQGMIKSLLRGLITLSLVCSTSTLLSVCALSEAHGHAWRGQAVVLFVTYEVRDDAVNVTLGLPAPLFMSEVSRLTLGERREAPPRNIAALYEAPKGPERLLEALKRLITRDLKILVDRRSVAKLNLNRVDLIINANTRRGGSLQLDDDKRQVMLIGDVEVELHRGAPSALVVKASAPLSSPPRELSLRWESERWFSKRGRRGRRRDQLDTREVPGIIVDREGITPLSFTPREPEVIWRSPDALKAPSKSVKPQRHALRATSEGAAASPVDLFETLHRSIYDAFSHERDEEIYDALSASLDGSALDEVFSSVYQALIMRDEGGARAQVTHVIKLGIKQLNLDDSLARAAQLKRLLQSSKRPHHIFHYRWRVAGEVSHWGHTHRRVHDYEALYVMTEVMTETTQGWRITHAAPLRQTRRPELEGAL